MTDNTPGPNRVRADIWLWAARFFKTRRMSRKAIDGGKVQCNGVRCKPAKAVKPGDRLCITLGQASYTIDVLALADKRGPARVAQTLYRETQASRKKRQARQELLQNNRVHKPANRPDKDDRRTLRQLKRRGW